MSLMMLAPSLSFFETGGITGRISILLLSMSCLVKTHGVQCEYVHMRRSRVVLCLTVGHWTKSFNGLITVASIHSGGMFFAEVSYHIHTFIPGLIIC